MKNFIGAVRVFANCAGLALAIYGLAQFYSTLELRDREGIAIAESMWLPINLEAIRGRRAGIDDLNDGTESPEKAQVFWQRRVQQVITSHAFADLVADSTKLKVTNPGLGFDQDKFVKSLSHPAVPADDALFRNVVLQIYMRASTNVASAGEEVTLKIVQSSMAMVIGLMLLLASQLSGGATKLRRAESALALDALGGKAKST